MFKYLVCISFIVTACGGETRLISKLKEEWNPDNDPAHLQRDYKKVFEQLPLSGSAEKTPWSDDYWPSYRGGIASRWNNGESGFAYKTMSLDEIKQASSEQLAKLSPAEKYDIYRGNYKFDLVQSERRRTSANDPTWEGLCHGWAAAALQFNQPHEVVLENADGVKVPFGSSDIKALLLYNQAQSYQPSRMLGDRCNEDFNAEHPDRMSPECRDTNAGSFHLILANLIGIQKSGFVGDMRRDYQVWNHPVFGFESEVVSKKQGKSPGAAPATVLEITMRTTVHYAVEVSPSWKPIDSSDYGQTQKEFQYRLEINRMGEVIGGEWLEEDRPDFLWTQGKAPFSGDFAKLKDIYEASLL